MKYSEQHTPEFQACPAKQRPCKLEDSGNSKVKYKPKLHTPSKHNNDAKQRVLIWPWNEIGCHRSLMGKTRKEATCQHGFIVLHACEQDLGNKLECTVPREVQVHAHKYSCGLEQSTGARRACQAYTKLHNRVFGSRRQESNGVLHLRKPQLSSKLLFALL